MKRFKTISVKSEEGQPSVKVTIEVNGRTWGRAATNYLAEQIASDVMISIRDRTKKSLSVIKVRDGRI